MGFGSHVINKMLRVRGSKKEGIQKEQIINYEYRMIELSLPLVEPVICNPSKYAPWELQSKIEATVGKAPHSVRWVGCSETAYLQSYAYIMLMGTGPREEQVMEFKQTVYRMGRKCLPLAEQKLLVEFLCLIEYSRDKYSFLNKYPQIEAIFVRILRYLEEEHSCSDDSTPERPKKVKRRLKGQSGQGSPRSQSLSQQLEYQRELEQIYKIFGECFKFITLVTSNEFSCTFRLFQDRMTHLLIEKDCYFVLELAETEAHNYSIGVHPARSKRTSHPSQSSSAQFDKKAFLDILNYKSEVEESNVISVQRGSQIRKSPDSLPLNTPKFHSAIHAFACPQEFQIQKNEQRQEHDRTFIDELLNNVVMPEQPKRDKMKAILAIKEELKRVQLRIQGKIRLIDEAKPYQRPPDLAHTPHIPTSNILNAPSQKLQSSKGKGEQKEFLSNIVKESVVRKHEASNFVKKQRKTSYNSVRIIPHARHFIRPDQHIDPESPYPPSSPNNRGSARPLQRVERMLSEKAISRPQSNLKGKGEQGKYRSRSPQGMIRKQYNVRSLSPKNVSVNVNVNINENMLTPSFPMPYKQLYHHPNNKHFPQYYPHAYARPKPPPFLQRVRSKMSNPEASFPNGKMNLLVAK